MFLFNYSYLIIIEIGIVGYKSNFVFNITSFKEIKHEKTTLHYNCYYRTICTG